MTTTDRPRRKCAHYGSWHGYKETNYENERDTDAMGVKVDVGGREEREVAGSALAACPEFGARDTRRDSVTSRSQARRTQSLCVLRTPNSGHDASAGTSSVGKNSDEDRVLSLPPPTTTAAP